MADVFTPAERSRVMGLIRSKNTKPELQTRRALHRLGFRFRIHDKRLPGRPDIVLPKYRTVVQVRGCFWHGHNCSVGKAPKSNLAYWLPKIRRTIERDAANDFRLAEMGWTMRVIRECDCRKADRFGKVIEDLVRILRKQNKSGRAAESRASYRLGSAPINLSQSPRLPRNPRSHAVW
jgi:DNA mismatch endonuclease (patch repair protein)